jgi:hypothetical protein
MPSTDGSNEAPEPAHGAGQFSPPLPPPATSGLAVVGHMLAVMVMAVGHVVSHGLLFDGGSSLLRSLFRRRETWTIDELLPQVDLSGTAPLRPVGGGQVLCTGCDAAVPFASLSLSEHGSFCTGCVAAMG